MEAKINNLSIELVSHERRISDLEAQLSVLKDVSEGYLRTRHGFLDAFRRDILKIPDVRGTTRVEVTEVAYNGDAVADASLFESGSRNDDSLMYKIYGLTARQVLVLSRSGDYESISVINARATLKSDEDRNAVSREIEEAWSDYVFQLEQNWGQIPEEEQESPLTLAYYRFWDAVGRGRRE